MQCHGGRARKCLQNGYARFLFGITAVILPVKLAELITHYALLLSACLKAITAVQNVRGLVLTAFQMIS